MRAIHVFVSFSLLLGSGPCVPVKAGPMPAEAGVQSLSARRGGELVSVPLQFVRLEPRRDRDDVQRAHPRS